MTTRVIIVLGKKPNTQTICHEFQNRCDLAVERVAMGMRNVLVLSGWHTTLFGTEAELALPYMLGCLERAGHANRVEVYCESVSRTTPENIVFTQQLLTHRTICAPPDELVIIGRASQMRKVRVVVKKVWVYGKPKVSYVGVVDTASPLMRWIDEHPMVWLSHLDPYGTSFIYRALKKLSRNG